MARKRNAKKLDDRPRRTKPSRTRTVYTRAKSGSRKMGMRWGEAILAALVGYEGDKILDGVGAGNIAFPYMARQPQINEAMTALDASGKGGSSPGQTADILINKTAGLAAILKSAYDVVKHKRLSDQDKNILIPYAIGTVFDGPGTSGNSSHGAWK